MEDIKGTIKGRRIAVIATNGFEQSELEEPLRALTTNGAHCEIIALTHGTIKGWSEGDWGKEIPVDKLINEVSSDDYEALLIPGGTLNCDKLRMNQDAVQFVSSFFYGGKPIAAICHGPQLLIEADAVDGIEMTSCAAVRKDLENAGAKWADQEVVVDKGIVTSRSPKDLPRFIEKMLEEFAEGLHPR